MRILLDIDDTLCITSPLWSKETEKYMEQNKLARIRSTSEDVYDLALSYALDEQQREQYYKYMSRTFLYTMLQPVEGAKQFIKKVLDDGHTVEFITSRPPHKYSETVKWLNEVLLVDSPVIHHKLFIDDLEMDLLIDNSERRIKDATCKKIPAILFAGVNIEKDDPSDLSQLFVVHTFEEVYQCVKELEAYFKDNRRD